MKQLLGLLLTAVLALGLAGCSDGAIDLFDGIGVSDDSGASEDAGDSGADGDAGDSDASDVPSPTDESSPGEQTEAPTAQPDTVLRPTFDTVEGPIAAGTAFLVQWDDGRTLMLTAQHLFGEAGGMSRDYTGAELPDVVDGVESFSADDDTVTVASNELVTIPDANAEDITRDLAAFVVDDPGQAQVLPLGDSLPESGEPVFLLGQTADGSAPRLYPAVVGDLGDDTGMYLGYEFTAESGMTANLLPGTSGAPVLNADGEVIGLQKGGGDMDDGTTWGFANGVETIRQALEANL